MTSAAIVVTLKLAMLLFSPLLSVCFLCALLFSLSVSFPLVPVHFLLSSEAYEAIVATENKINVHSDTRTRARTHSKKR